MITTIYVRVSSHNIKAHTVALSPGDIFENRKPKGSSLSRIYIHPQSGPHRGSVLRILHGPDWTAIRHAYELKPLNGARFEYLRPKRLNYNIDRKLKLV